jgi:hypothetical protein
MRLASLLLCLLMLVIAGTLHAFAADAAADTLPAVPPHGGSLPPQGPHQRFAKNQLGDTIQLGELDNPANPYVGRYDEVDRWHWDNWVPQLNDEEQQSLRLWPMSEERKAFEAKYPEGWSFRSMQVDEQGWLIPRTVQMTKVPSYDYSMGAKTIREYVQKINERSHDYVGPPADWQKRYFIWAVGVFPQEWVDRERHESDLIEARAWPPIPNWLGDNPPLSAVFAPNGDILTYGPLGLTYIKDPDRLYQQNPEGETWYRYSADGKLLSTFTPRVPSYYPGGRWEDVYADWAALLKLVAASTPNVNLQSYPGGGQVVTVYEQVPDENLPHTYYNRTTDMLAAYDFMGNPVDLDAPLPQLDWRVGNRIDREQIARVYKAQVELGITQPHLPSPWAGTSHGPVVVDSAPRQPRRFAYKWPQGRLPAAQPGAPEILELKPLDSPDNPYRGQYGPWDKWIMDQFGKSNPKQDQKMNEQMMRRNEEMQKARKENRKPDPKLLEMDYYQYDPSDPWKNYMMMADSNGYVLPYLQAQIRQQGQPIFERDWREPYTSTHDPNADMLQFAGGGIMPAELQLQLDDALKRTHPLQPIPPVPDWLAAAPPYSVIFVPNGDVLTYGELGSWQEGWDKLPKEQRKAAGGWYRYSSSGELLGQVTGQGSGILQLYNPLAPSLEMSGKAQGFQVESPAGYLIWRQPVEKGGAAVAAWDYDGTPLDLSRPLKRAPGMWSSYTWEEVKYKLEAEQLRRSQPSN